MVEQNLSKVVDGAPYANNAPGSKFRKPTVWLSGVEVGDTIPAVWWNWMWNRFSKEQIAEVHTLDSLCNEILSVLTHFEVQPEASKNNQLLSCIQKLKSNLTETIDLLQTNIDEELKKKVAEINDRLNNLLISVVRLGPYLIDVTYNGLEEFDPNFVIPVQMGCSSFVKKGCLYRNLDFDYTEDVTVKVNTKDFIGLGFFPGLDNSHITEDNLKQLPYHIVDGVNKYGIMVSMHLIYNDFNWVGKGEIPLYKVPYEILTRMKTIDDDISEVLNNLKTYPSAGNYVLQFLVTDGVTTKAIVPIQDGETYEVLDATTNPKMTNFLWINSPSVTRNILQERPTGVERFNMMPCELQELQFTKAYKEPNRLSEFIGIDNTTKASTDEELLNIYERAKVKFESRTRDGQTWHTMHSAVYSKEGIQELYVQEQWDKNYVGSSGLKELPIATKDTLGAIKVGLNLYMLPDGTLNAQSASGQGDAYNYVLEIEGENPIISWDTLGLSYNEFTKYLIFLSFFENNPSNTLSNYKLTDEGLQVLLKTLRDGRYYSHTGRKKWGEVKWGTRKWGIYAPTKIGVQINIIPEVI